MSLLKATRKLKRVGKTAVQFRITSTFEFIEVECKGTWRPENLRVVWLRNHRKVKSNDTTLVINEDFGPNGANGRAVFSPAISVSLVVTLYRDANHTDFDEKDYKYHIESEGSGGKKVLATFNCNVADFVGIPSTKQALDLNFKCVSKKVKIVKLGITLESQFMKEGGALDDDMQSTFSAISMGQESLLNYDDEEEEDEEEEEFPLTTPVDNVLGTRGRLNTLQEEPENESDESYVLSSVVLGTGEHLKRQTLPRSPPPKPPRHEEATFQLPTEQEASPDSSERKEEAEGMATAGESSEVAHSGTEAVIEKEAPFLSPPALSNSVGEEPHSQQPYSPTESNLVGKESSQSQQLSLPPAENISEGKETPHSVLQSGKSSLLTGKKSENDMMKEKEVKATEKKMKGGDVKPKVPVSQEKIPEGAEKGGPGENSFREDDVLHEEVKPKHPPSVGATSNNTRLVNETPARGTSNDPPVDPPVMSGDLPATPSDPPANPPVMSGDPPATSNDPPTTSGDPPATSPAKSGDLPLTNGHKSDSLSKASSESELSEKHESNVTTGQQEVDAYGREINGVGGGSGGFDSLFETARSLAAVTANTDKNVSVDTTEDPLPSPPGRPEPSGDAVNSSLEEDTGERQGGGEEEEEVVPKKKGTKRETWLNKEAVLVDCFDEVVQSEKLDQIDLIGLYFSAGWCPPCRKFLPKLVKFYHHLKEHKKSFEIVYISSDYSKQDMMKYMKEQQMPWLGVAYEGSVSEDMRKKFSVSAVPLFKIIGRNGEIVEESAKKSVEAASNGGAILKLYNKWHERAVHEEGEEERVPASLQKKRGLLSKVIGKKSKEPEQVELQSQTSNNGISASPPKAPEEFGRKSVDTRTARTSHKGRGGKAVTQESIDERDERIHHLEEVNRTLKQTNDELKEEMDELRRKLTDVTAELEQIKSTSKTLQAESKELIANLNMRGWLFKRGLRGLTASVWRRRYFRLDQGSKLYYYKNSSEGNPPQGFIDLDKVISVQEVTASQQDKNHATFTVQCDGRTFQLLAHDEPSMRKWMEAISYMKNWRRKHAGTISEDLSLP